MSLANIKLNNTKSGFTIVELLIVVVVIAILAAITIVSYNGITTRANASAAKATASTWQKKIELYQAETSSYPYSISDIDVAGKSYQINDTSFTAAAPTSDNGKSKVLVQPCGATAPTNKAGTSGIRITYYNYDSSPAGSNVINIGTTTACATALATS